MNSLTKPDVKKKLANKEFTRKSEVSSKCKSDVWKKFSKVVDNSGTCIGYVVCNTCGDLYLHGKNGNSAMSRHKCNGNQPCITVNSIKTIYFQDKRASTKEMKDKVTKSCVEMCCRDIRPFEVVAGDGFLDLQQQVNFNCNI